MNKTYIALVLFCFLSSCKLDGQVIGLDLLGYDKEASIDFDFAQDYILVNIKLGGKIPLRFIFDTGAQHTILFDRLITDLLGFEYDDRIRVMGSDLSQEVGALICRNVKIGISGLAEVNRDIVVLEENYLKLKELTGEHIHGIIGGAFFRNLVVDINYKSKEIKLFHPEHFNRPSSKYEELDISIHNNKPYVNAEITQFNSTIVKSKLLIDTGASLAFLLHTDSDSSIQLPEKVIKGNLGIGIGGFLEGFIGKTKRLSFGPYTFDNMLTNYQSLDSLFLVNRSYLRDGIIGNSLLARFRVIIDYHRAKMYLKPLKGFDEDFEYDKSGLFLLAFGKKLNQYIVSDVLPGSPADEANILPGDIIKKVGFWHIRFLSLENINHKLSGKPGKKIKLKIQRGEECIKKTLILRDMLKDGGA